MPKQKPKLLITGISGFLGSYFLQHPLDHWEKVGVYHQNPVLAPDMATYPLDLTDERALNAFLDYHQPAAIFHLAALSNANFCEQQPALSAAVNVLASVQMAQWAAKTGSSFLFASTDLVFDGQDAPYDEQSKTEPINVYGTHKAEAEKKILDLYPSACIARLPLMYGYSAATLGFMSNWLKQLENGQPIKAFTDEYRTAAPAHEVIEALLLLLRQKVEGIWHLGGKERLSRFDFAQRMALEFGLSTDLVLPSLQSEVTMAAARPADVSLNSDKAMQLGYHASTTEEALRQINNFRKNGVKTTPKSTDPSK